MPNILLIGNGAREHALAEAITRSEHKPKLFSFMKSNNPGIASLSEKIKSGSYSDLDAVTKFSAENKIEFAVIGPEDPLKNGVVDALAQINVPAVGPTQSLARLETSKSFTRDLVSKYNIPGNPQFKVFETMDGVEDFLNQLKGIVLKPDGLTGGKGVQVQGDHFETRKDALKLCEQILTGGSSLIVEEKFDGEEFSLQCLCDGIHVVATPLVQDHKRRFDGDKGPNTGGMGSYSGRPFDAFFETTGFTGRTEHYPPDRGGVAERNRHSLQGRHVWRIYCHQKRRKTSGIQRSFRRPRSHEHPAASEIGFRGDLPPHHCRNAGQTED